LCYIGQDYCHNITSPEADEKDVNTAIVTHGSKTRSITTNDNACKIRKWRDDNNYEESEDSPIQPFKKSSNQMSIHALKCHVPMILEDSYKKSYNNSDGGRRKKVEKVSSLSNYLYSTDESSEYESPDEDWYYDPRRTSKWTWSNDYSSITTDNNSESTITELTDYDYLKDNNNNGTFKLNSIYLMSLFMLLNILLYFMILIIHIKAFLSNNNIGT
jgi:hypothetical protein